MITVNSTPLHALPADPEVDGQIPLPLVWQLPSGLPARPEAPPHLRLVAEDDGADQLPPPPTRAWVAQIARAISEVADGERPPAQLTRWVGREELRRLAARAIAVQRHPSGKGLRRRAPMNRVGSVRVCRVSPTAAEACAVLIGPERARAVALRFEATDDRWVVTAISLG